MRGTRLSGNRVPCKKKFISVIAPYSGSPIVAFSYKIFYKCDCPIFRVLYSNVFKPYSDVLKSYSGVFLQKFFISPHTGFKEPYSSIFKPNSDVLKPYNGVLELDFLKIKFHAFFFFLVLLGIIRFSTNQVFH